MKKVFASSPHSWLNEKILKVVFVLTVIAVGLYFTYPELSEAQKISYAKSYGITLILTSGGIVIGIALGFMLAFLKFLNNKFLSFIIDEYVDIIRGTPIVIQLMVFVFIIFATWSNNIAAAIFALGLNSSAYVAEIVRSGINSVDKGQMEAGRSLGLSYFQTMKLIILPQALKNSLPALGNEFISLVKESSIVYFVGVADIMFTANTVKNATYQTFGPYLVAAAIYFIITSILSLLVKRLEKKLTK